MKKYIYIVILLLILLITFITFLVSKQTDTVNTFADLPYSEDSMRPTDSLSVVPTGVGFFPENTRPFNTLFTHKITQEFETVLHSIHLDTYAILPCSLEKGNTVMLTAKYIQDQQGNNTIEQAFQNIKQWEPYLLNDIGNFVFPTIQQEEKTQTLTFANVPDTSYRRSPVVISGEDHFIYTAWLLNYVLYSNSLQCLQESASLIYEGD